ncbi:ATP-binding cassette domain-containing protein [Acidiferrimicrobium sp. IK]|uniref:ABC transporter ATP-binding protein n=1 Tax=Acidiferrimicrobium sp. IK TaxID=2871700 RepID=UPI0021CB07E4|nr:ATP-binding cassette domain-containing protein [Acidiferrimicrobium sp. IK]MCU4186675.1 ATP-binding cassette domain-containing protein [Acidiferrimicrobium sp. IK]
MTETTQVVLSAQEVTVEFGLGHGKTLRAVDGVSFDLHAGEVIGIVGESGSGKSTLGKVLAGFLNPTSGQVQFRAADGGLRARHQRGPHGFRDVQMIFQESAMALNPRLPVWRLVGEAVSPNLITFPASGRRRVDTLRDEVATHLQHAGLDPAAMAGKRVAELSGGEKQRVAIARALAASPVAMVCDESVSALDVTIRAAVLNLFQRLSRDMGVALVFITHDISVVAHLADRVAVMYHGQLVELDTPARVIEDPQHEYTRRLIAAVPTLEQRPLLSDAR